MGMGHWELGTQNWELGNRALPIAHCPLLIAHSLSINLSGTSTLFRRRFRNSDFG
ncbi:MAG: hypothetical protein KME30_00920 [Iphinoe sp. HA4291-MV1]|nr:hypothetical protein [Iphinoe sp. HA4291-MV1]